MSKKHHYVPRGLLKHFAFGRKHNQVFVFDKVRQSSYTSNLVDAGSENYFNTIELAGQTISFEGAFQDCDDRLAVLAKRIVENQRLSVLSDQDRRELAYLAAIQFLRVKLVRTTLLEITRSLLRVFRERGGTVGPDLEKEMLGVDETAVRAMSIQQLRAADEMAKHFLSKDWALLVAPGSDPFWISDNPIVTNNMFPYGDNGLASEGIELCWPLGSRVLLVFRCPTIANKVELVSPARAKILRSGQTVAAKPVNIEYYNSLQVFQSSRFLYASTKEFRLARRALRDHPELEAEQLSKMEFGTLGEIPRKSRMPAGRWLVAFGSRTHHMCPIDQATSTPSGVAILVSPSAGERTVEALLGDAPHSKMEVYQDKVAIHMMRDVILERESGHPERIQIYPRDPSLKALLEKSGGG